MIKKSGITGDLTDKVQGVASDTKKSSQIKPSDFGEEAIGQLDGYSSADDQGTNEQQAAQALQSQQMSDQDRQDNLQNLYGPTDKKAPSAPTQPVQSKKKKKGGPISNALGLPQDSAKTHPVGEAVGINKDAAKTHPVGEALGAPQHDPHKNMSPEEIENYERLKRKLHQEHVEATFTPPKQQEERPAEERDREEEEKKMEELEQKKDIKNQDLQPAKTKGTSEKTPGASG